MLYSTKTIMESMNKDSNSISDLITENVCFFEMALEGIREADDTINQYMLSEGKVLDLFTRNVNKDKPLGLDINVPDNIKNIFNKIIEWFKNNIDKLITYALKVYEGFKPALRTIENNKSKMEKYNGADIEYNKDVFSYYTGSKKNHIEYFETLIKTVTNDMEDQFKYIEGSHTIEEIYRRCSEVIDNAEDPDEFSVRNMRLIVNSNTIGKADYGKALYKLFRNGKSEAETLDYINPVVIRDELDKYKKYYEEINEIKSFKRKIDLDIANARRRVNNLDLNFRVDVSDNQVTAKIKTSKQKIVSIALRKIQLCLNNYLIYYGALMDSMKESRKQNIDILLTAAKYIERNSV